MEQLLHKEEINDLITIAPDNGASERARYYADVLSCDDIGTFMKRRDLTKVVNGKNPIKEHQYLGASVTGKTCIVVDDMIASGGSIIEVGQILRKLGASKIIFITTFALFTEGIEKFDLEYQNKTFDKLYTTNLSYIPQSYREKEWLEVVNCSKQLAEIINGIHDSKSIGHLVGEDREKVLKLSR